MEWFDIAIWVIQYGSSHFVYLALYQRYLILKILTFNIKVLAIDISYPILIFYIEGFYTLLNLLKNIDIDYWISLKTIDIDIEGLILSFNIKELNFDIELLSC